MRLRLSRSEGTSPEIIAVKLAEYWLEGPDSEAV
jgi:hypothetical protein